MSSQTTEASTGATLQADPAVDAWRAILELVGWGGARPPHFPTVALRLDLSPKQMGVLLRLDPGGAELPMRAIAEQLYCDASYVTDLVDRLEERGLIERRSDPDDRRVKLLALTEAGEELRERALSLLYEPPEELRSLPEADRRTLSELLAKAVGAGREGAP